MNKPGKWQNLQDVFGFGGGGGGGSVFCLFAFLSLFSYHTTKTGSLWGSHWWCPFIDFLWVSIRSSLSAKQWPTNAVSDLRKLIRISWATPDLPWIHWSSTPSLQTEWKDRWRFSNTQEARDRAEEKSNQRSKKEKKKIPRGKKADIQAVKQRELSCLGKLEVVF